MTIILGILEEGLVYAIMALGVYITYKILDFPDLSVDGTFPLGAAVTAAGIAGGFLSPVAALFVSFLAGALAGCVTGLIHVKLKVRDLLSGIIVMTALYSINLRITGKANLPIFSKETIFSNEFLSANVPEAFKPYTTTLILLVLAVLCKVLLDACINGSSELMTNLSLSLVNILYNYQLLRFAGENGVAAYGVIMYACFLFIAVYVGYAFGSAPIVSFHYGAGSRAEVHNLYEKSLRLIAVVAVTLTAASMVIIPCVARIFVGYDPELLALTSRAFRLFALSFVIMGFNVYASSFFTALGDGVTSALISFLRTLVFQIAAVLILPAILGIDGIWLAVTAAELAALAVSAAMLLTKDKVFHYRKA